MLVGGAIINALAFSGSNYLFQQLSGNGAAERIRHDKAIEQLQRDREIWSRNRTEKIDWINKELRREGLANRDFSDVNEAIKEYHAATGKHIILAREPVLSDYYTPSNSQKKYEITFVIVGMTAVCAFTYEYFKE